MFISQEQNEKGLWILTVAWSPTIVCDLEANRLLFLSLEGSFRELRLEPQYSLLGKRIQEQVSELTAAAPCARPYLGLHVLVCPMSHALGVPHGLVLCHPPCNPFCDARAPVTRQSGLCHVGSGHHKYGRHRDLCADTMPISLAFRKSFLRISFNLKLEDSVPSLKKNTF